MNTICKIKLILYISALCGVCPVYIFYPSSLFASSYSIQQICFTKEDFNGRVYGRRKEYTDFKYPEDSKIVLYCNLYNKSKDYNIKASWYTPQGDLYWTHKDVMHQIDKNLKGYYETFRLMTEKMKGYPGKWKVEVYVDGELARTLNFNLSSSYSQPQEIAHKPELQPSINQSNDSRYYYERGNTSFEEKKYKEAIMYYEKAIETKKYFPPLFYNLAMSQMAIGRSKDAVTNFKNYLLLRPNADNAKDVQSIIKSLEQ